MSTHDFTDLILLVGTNPLPNYVTAKYFLKNNEKLEKIWLVHSEQNFEARQESTKDLADSIKKVLKDELEKEGPNKKKINLVSLSDISSAKEIEKNIKEKLIKKIRGEGGSIHLNYTGGTKSMAVHSYRTIEKEKVGKCSFSYLDAQASALKDDRKGALTEDLRKEIKISLTDLVKMHGCEKKKDKRERETYMEEFKRLLLECNTAEEFKVAKSESNKDYGPTLEEYVYEILNRKISADEQLKKENIEIAKNWHVENTPGVGKKTFELDVILLNGYQVCGISCATTQGGREWKGSEAECKKKGFEVLHRVKQIGGDEAKAVLLVLLPGEKTEEIEKDLKLISGSSEDKFKVIGYSTVRCEDSLWEALKEHIWGER